MSAGALRRSGAHTRGAVLVATWLLVLMVAGCGSSSTKGSGESGVISAVGAENEYANVLGQIGGRYVHVSSILNNPNTDPHTFESSPSVAQQVSAAQLIVQNGVGYDTFMNKIESASPNPKRKLIVVQNVLGLPTDTPNPHPWCAPRAMPAVANVIAADLSALAPAHATYFQANLTKFITSLAPLHAAIAAFKAILGAATGRDRAAAHQPDRRRPDPRGGARRRHHLARSVARLRQLLLGIQPQRLPSQLLHRRPRLPRVPRIRPPDRSTPHTCSLAL